MLDNELTVLAYLTGKKRGTSLSAGYYINSKTKEFFCQNPNNSGGIVVGKDHSYYLDNLPGGFERVDMSELLAQVEGR